MCGIPRIFLEALPSVRLRSGVLPSISTAPRIFRYYISYCRFSNILPHQATMSLTTCPEYGENIRIRRWSVWINYERQHIMTSLTQLFISFICIIMTRIFRYFFFSFRLVVLRNYLEDRKSLHYISLDLLYRSVLYHKLVDSEALISKSHLFSVKSTQALKDLLKYWNC